MEAAKPNHTFNPALQSLYRAVIHRTKHPDDTGIPAVRRVGATV